MLRFDKLGSRSGNIYHINSCFLNIWNTFFKFYFYIYLHVYTLFEPPPPPPPCRTCSTLLFSNFVEEKTYKVKRKTAFLLVWDEGSYTWRFLALFPCTCVLQPKLVHLYQTSSLLSSPLPIVVSASLRVLCSFLYSEHINHIQVFGFLPFPSLPCVFSLT
jgi:hypothetical protein